jgi:hypothetical protein
VDLAARAALPCTLERAYAEVASLDGYPAWLGIVLAVERVAVVAGDGGPAWAVDIGARIGPLRRTKRVRMVRVHDEPPAAVRFERRELDGRAHSPWVLSASVAPAPSPSPSLPGCQLGIDLHYGGSAWLPLLDAVLAAEVRRAGGRLAARLA